MASKNDINMCEGPVLKSVIRVALPIFVLNLVQMSYSFADQIMAGRFAGSEALAAIGSVGHVTGLLTNLAIGLSLGANIVMGRAFGAKNEEEISKTVHTTILLSIICGLFITILGVFLVEPMLSYMKVPKDVRTLSRTYLFITFLGMVPTMLYNFCASLLRAMGNTKTPMYVGIVSGILNVFLNFVFLVLLRMDVDGVAIASVISTAFAAGYCFSLFLKTDESYKVYLRKLVISTKEIADIMRLGIPSGIQAILHTYANLSVQIAVNSFGAVVVAGTSASTTVESLVHFFGSAMTASATTFVSQNVGAENYDRIKKGTTKILLFTAFGGMVMSLLVNIFAQPLLYIFTGDPAVVQAGLIRIRLVGSIYFTCGISDVIIAVLRAKGHAYFPTVVSFFCTCLLRVVWIYTVFTHFKTLESAYMVYLVSWLTAIIINYAFMKFDEKKPIKN